MIAAESMTGLICPGFSDVLAYIAAVLIIPESLWKSKVNGRCPKRSLFGQFFKGV